MTTFFAIIWMTFVVIILLTPSHSYTPARSYAWREREARPQSSFSKASLKEFLARDDTKALIEKRKKQGFKYLPWHVGRAEHHRAYPYMIRIDTGKVYRLVSLSSILESLVPVDEYGVEIEGAGIRLTPEEIWELGFLWGNPTAGSSWLTVRPLESKLIHEYYQDDEEAYLKDLYEREQTYFDERYDGKPEDDKFYGQSYEEFRENIANDWWYRNAFHDAVYYQKLKWNRWETERLE